MEEGKVITILSEHTKTLSGHGDRLDRIETAVLDHGDRLDRIETVVMDHTDRLDRIEETMVKQDEFREFKNEIMDAMDRQTVILTRLDHDMVSQRNRFERLEKKVETLAV